MKDSLLPRLALILLILSTGIVLAQSPQDDFVNVTDEILNQPDDEDWVHWRRTYDSWNFSPLTQIDRDNIGGVQLAWSRMMYPGRMEAMPLVSDGVMSLPHPSDVIQALDATTGDLIWE